MDEFGGHEDATLTVQRAMKRVSEDELFEHLRSSRATAMTSWSRRGLHLLI
ncbi:Hypothetical protein FKW44_005644 [Caligus rogercresseyi]|uniref:Uncharacterized protein n=1 Tax=Caligus rogercresseyi TaxID=217165 RepID=A0A7T8KC87_CALRO|nr:Hypothetical protein FKW44_005644 [Caligus rogercresseyi]